MEITSPAFEHNGFIPADFTCDEEDFNPPLEISGVPEETQSLVLIVEDPDAPNGTWTHWTVWNISPDTTEIAADDVPDGAEEGMTSFGNVGYGGPCPPAGTHHYCFTLYALDCRLEISTDATRTELEQAMIGHVITEAELIGLYGK